MVVGSRTANVAAFERELTGFPAGLAFGRFRDPRPAVVFVSDGTARVVVRRETFDDLVGLDA